jgi:hypothetical protein
MAADPAAATGGVPASVGSAGSAASSAVGTGSVVGASSAPASVVAASGPVGFGSVGSGSAASGSVADASSAPVGASAPVPAAASVPTGLASVGPQPAGPEFKISGSGASGLGQGPVSQASVAGPGLTAPDVAATPPDVAAARPADAARPRAASGPATSANAAAGPVRLVTPAPVSLQPVVGAGVVDNNRKAASSVAGRDGLEASPPNRLGRAPGAGRSAAVPTGAGPSRSTIPVRPEHGAATEVTERGDRTVADDVPLTAHGVHLAVRLFAARYNGWLDQVVRPRAERGDPAALDAQAVLDGSVGPRLKGLIEHQDERAPTALDLVPGVHDPELSQQAWHRFVDVVQDYDRIRSRLVGLGLAAVPAAEGGDSLRSGAASDGPVPVPSARTLAGPPVHDLVRTTPSPADKVINVFMVNDIGSPAGAAAYSADTVQALAMQTFARYSHWKSRVLAPRVAQDDPVARQADNELQYFSGLVLAVAEPSAAARLLHPSRSSGDAAWSRFNSAIDKYREVQQGLVAQHGAAVEVVDDYGRVSPNQAGRLRLPSVAALLGPRVGDLAAGPDPGVGAVGPRPEGTTVAAAELPSEEVPKAARTLSLRLAVDDAGRPVNGGPWLAAYKALADFLGAFRSIRRLPALTGVNWKWSVPGGQPMTLAQVLDPDELAGNTDKLLGGQLNVHSEPVSSASQTIYRLRVTAQRTGHYKLDAGEVDGGNGNAVYQGRLQVLVQAATPELDESGVVWSGTGEPARVELVERLSVPAGEQADPAPPPPGYQRRPPRDQRPLGYEAHEPDVPAGVPLERELHELTADGVRQPLVQPVDQSGKPVGDSLLLGAQRALVTLFDQQRKSQAEAADVLARDWAHTGQNGATVTGPLEDHLSLANFAINLPGLLGSNSNSMRLQVKGPTIYNLWITAERVPYKLNTAAAMPDHAGNLMYEAFLTVRIRAAVPARRHQDLDAWHNDATGERASWFVHVIDRISVPAAVWLRPEVLPHYSVELTGPRLPEYPVEHEGSVDDQHRTLPLEPRPDGEPEWQPDDAVVAVDGWRTPVSLDGAVERLFALDHVTAVAHDSGFAATHDAVVPDGRETPPTDEPVEARPPASAAAGEGEPARDVAGRVRRRRGWQLIGDVLDRVWVAKYFAFLPYVNPERSTTNCVLTSVVTDGYLASVIEDPASLVQQKTWSAPESVATEVGVLEFYAGRPLEDVAGYEVVTAAMRRAPVGSRGVLVVNEVGDAVAHAFNVVTTKFGVVYLDGQRGALAEAPVNPVRVRFLATTDHISVPVVVGTVSPPVSSVDVAGSTPMANPGSVPDEETSWGDVRARVEEPVGISSQYESQYEGDDGPAVPAQQPASAAIPHTWLTGAWTTPKAAGQQVRWADEQERSSPDQDDDDYVRLIATWGRTAGEWLRIGSQAKPDWAASRSFLTRHRAQIQAEGLDEPAAHGKSSESSVQLVQGHRALLALDDHGLTDRAYEWLTEKLPARRAKVMIDAVATENTDAVRAFGQLFDAYDSRRPKEERSPRESAVVQVIRQFADIVDQAPRRSVVVEPDVNVALAGGKTKVELLHAMFAAVERRPLPSRSVSEALKAFQMSILHCPGG